MPNRYADAKTVDFAIFPNQFKDNDKAPVKSGKIEFTREFLKEMVAHAKESVAVTSDAADDEDDGLPF